MANSNTARLPDPAEAPLTLAQLGTSYSTAMNAMTYVLTSLIRPSSARALSDHGFLERNTWARLVHTGQAVSLMGRLPMDELAQFADWLWDTHRGPDGHFMTPQDLYWNLACLFDASTTAFDRFVRTLDEDEMSTMYGEFLERASILMALSPDTPTDYAQFREYVAESYAGGTVCREAFAVADRALHPPHPGPLRPVIASVRLTSRWLAPPVVLEQFRIPTVSESTNKALSLLARGLREGRISPPKPVRRMVTNAFEHGTQASAPCSNETEISPWSLLPRLLRQRSSTKKQD